MIGSLISFTLRGISRYFFVGAAVKKPQMQILLEVFPNGNSEEVEWPFFEDAKEMPPGITCVVCLTSFAVPIQVHTLAR